MGQLQGQWHTSSSGHAKDLAIARSSIRALQGSMDQLHKKTMPEPSTTGGAGAVVGALAAFVAAALTLAVWRESQK
jgi:hypothetical protein